MRKTPLIGVAIVLAAASAVAGYAAISPTLTNKLAAVLSDPAVPQSQKEYNEAVCDEIKRIWAELDKAEAEPCTAPAAPPSPLPPPSPPPAEPGCTRSLSSGEGSLESFAAGLEAGETGCLSGTFTEDVSISNSGFTLRSSAGQRALLRGRVSIGSSAADVILDSLDFDGSALTSFSQLYVDGDRVKLRNVDMNGGGRVNCVLAGAGGGSNRAEWAIDLVIEKSRIHHCGDNDHEHGIYAEFTDGLVIRDSYFYASAGYGLHFYPSAQNSLVEHTVVDGNATAEGNGYNVTFSGEETPGEYALPFSSNNNRIVNSILSFPARNGNVVSYYPGNSPVPVGNEVAFNCVFGGSPNFHVYEGPLGYLQLGNAIVDPRYVDRAAGNFTVQEPLCTGKGPR